MPNSGKDDGAMTSSQFRAWRKEQGLRQKEAADLLGLKKRMIQYYEKGERDGKKVAIPKTVRLACYALAKGIADFDGTDVTALSGDFGSFDDGD
jgi:transcriptional regulator with XRE-family HTH domain